MPRVSSRVVIDIASNQVIERSSYLYDGPWELAKGDNSKAEMQRANTISDQQMQLMKQQLGMQQSQLNMVNPSLQAIIENKGMLPEQEAAMRTQAMQGLGGQYKNLQGQLSQQLAARGVTGGGMAGGGDIARSFGSLGAMEAGQQSDLLNQIQLAKGQGLMGALQTGLGEASMFGNQSLGFGSQGVGALGSGVTAANNADQASTAFWGSLVGGLAGMGGSALGNPALCVASGTMILCAGEEKKAVGTVRPGDMLVGLDGSLGQVLSTGTYTEPCLELFTKDGDSLVCTPSHTVLRPRGGYVRANESLNHVVKTVDGEKEIVRIADAGDRIIHQLRLNGTHTYLTGIFWSEE